MTVVLKPEKPVTGANAPSDFPDEWDDLKGLIWYVTRMTS